MKSIQITVSDDELQEIFESIAKEMGIEMVPTPEKGCYNCRWYENFDSECCNPHCKWFSDFRNDTDICEKWKE